MAPNGDAAAVVVGLAPNGDAAAVVVGLAPNGDAAAVVVGLAPKALGCAPAVPACLPNNEPGLLAPNAGTPPKPLPLVGFVAPPNVKAPDSFMLSVLPLLVAADTL